MIIALSVIWAFSACQKGDVPKDSMVRTSQNAGPIVKSGAGPLASAPVVQAPGVSATGTPTISFESKEFDFGKIDQGEKVEHIFSFKNTGNAELNIDKVRSS